MVSDPRRCAPDLSATLRWGVRGNRVDGCHDDEQAPRRAFAPGCRLTGESYTAARAKIRAEGAVTIGLMHVTNGDSAAISLKEALSKDVLPWPDVLHAGPVPSLPPGHLRLARARFLAQRYGRKSVLWPPSSGNATGLFSHIEAGTCSGLIPTCTPASADRDLVALRRNGVGAGSISLINPGEMIGRAHFAGLGELPPAALANLLLDAVTLVPETLEVAATAWSAFRSANVTGLVAIARTADSQLRFLGEALGRLLQVYPSLSDGLSLTERRALLAVADSATNAGVTFRWVSERERRSFRAMSSSWTRWPSWPPDRRPCLRCHRRAAPRPPARLKWR
jgi:hypothetical protein